MVQFGENVTKSDTHFRRYSCAQQTLSLLLAVFGVAYDQHFVCCICERQKSLGPCVVVSLVPGDGDGVESSSSMSSESLVVVLIVSTPPEVDGTAGEVALLVTRVAAVVNGGFLLVVILLVVDSGEPSVVRYVHVASGSFCKRTVTR